VTTAAEREPIRLSCQTAETEEDAMTEWIDGFAETLGLEPLRASETERLLSSARDVAHRVERRITPLSTFLLGMAVAEGIAKGATRDVALDETLAALGRALPEATEAPG
jgi:hypothetical protein